MALYPDDPAARDRKARLFAVSMGSTWAKLLDLTLPIVSYFSATQFNFSIRCASCGAAPRGCLLHLNLVKTASPRALPPPILKVVSLVSVSKVCVGKRHAHPRLVAAFSRRLHGRELQPRSVPHQGVALAKRAGLHDAGGLLAAHVAQRLAPRRRRLPQRPPW